MIHQYRGGVGEGEGERKINEVTRQYYIIGCVSKTLAVSSMTSLNHFAEEDEHYWRLT